MEYVFLEDTAPVLPAEPALGIYRRWGKRVFDVAVTLMILPIALPVVLMAWALTRLDGGKGFYSQPRIGKDGTEFRCYKIRTMVPNADATLAELVRTDADIAREWRDTQKLARDPRITPVGRALRKTSVDELPQLWNVLKGEMSLIGPRPFTPGQRAIYDAISPQRPYYRMLPGITGLWQVDCRNSGSFTERYTYDARYHADTTFVGDLRIALKTVAVILKATGI